MPERHTAAPAIDQTIDQQSDPRPETTTPERKSWLDLSPIQVMGGALAAMTAAGLGSRFSVEGTVVGAALASVIAAVASALYTASLRRTSAAVRGVLGDRRIPVAKSQQRPKPVPSGSTAAPEPQPVAGVLARTSRRRSLVLRSVLGAVAIFALAGGSLTMYEAIAGRALSGGDGTTIAQVQRGGSEDRPTEKRSPAPADSAEPTDSADPTPTAESSDTPQAESVPSVEPSAEPSTEPSAVEPSPTAEAEPSGTTEPPAPSQTARTPR